jgi:predicted O-methyltransferase YrrM
MRMPGTRRLMLVAAAGSAAIVMGVLGLGFLDVLGFTDAIQLATTFVTLGILVLVLIGQRRVDFKIQRLTRSHQKHAEGAAVAPVAPEVRARLDDILSSLGEDRVMALTHNTTFSDRLGEVEQRVTAAFSTLTGGVSALRGPLDKVSAEMSTLSPKVAEISGRLAAIGRTTEAGYEQIEAYVDLRGMIPARAPMPALRGWAASPDVVRLLIGNVFQRRPKLIVECGSGSSSVWLGYAAEHIGSAKVIALEHDERFAALSRDLIRAHGLEEFVDIRLAPLTVWERDGQDRHDAYQWYDRAAIEDLADIGMVFVDGPPRATGHQARFPAIPLLLPRCNDDVLIVLDDTARDEESAISDRWMADYPELERTVRRFDKGAHVFTRRAE